MPRGPLPNPNARRRNTPTIKPTALPADGRDEPAPRVPSWIKLSKSGRAWWKWAWSTPQAAAWNTGDVAFIARRASLEDDMSVLGQVTGLDFEYLVDCLEERDGHRQFGEAVRKLSALATGRLQIAKEMRELDDRLGLTPKGMAALRWQIAEGKPKTGLAAVANLDDHRDLYGD